MITKDTTIGEVIDAYPIAAEILMNKGVHCIGCSARFTETIGEGLRAHGLSDKKVAEVIRELNKAAKIIIHVTPKAAKKLKELMKKEKKSGYCLRVQARNGKYGLDFNKTAKKDDVVVKSGGLTFIISKKALPKVRGARIDYIESPVPGFSIRGPRK